jgi:hypothetical protein
VTQHFRPIDHCYLHDNQVHFCKNPSLALLAGTGALANSERFRLDISSAHAC